MTRCQPWLGTLVEITVPAESAGCVEAAFAAIRHVHERMSFHSPDSDLARLRAAAPGEAATVDRETIVVLRAALDLYRASNGLFDIGIGAALVAAGFLPAVDTPGNGTSADIEIMDDETVTLRRPVLIDLGGIAKGYAVDRAIAVLRESGVPAACVNAGGDLAALGARHWPVALRDADGMVRHQMSLADAAMASSANLLDRRLAGGRSWSPHIGAGGKPVLSAGRVTIVADTCLFADAMTKIALADRVLAGALLRARGGEMLWESDMRGEG
ncbi:FAD:protein FMN transferase [uncultured Sphingomonas sp.]|uniref:FAD:protein FMN transferase n=1 Tax=uncultured Sphingomonas sp. TaxID=158754 RepID=UPI002634E6E8|nr:FAD:protein FMN transferase [uncultured Sphingomonas sp.]